MRLEIQVSKTLQNFEIFCSYRETSIGVFKMTKLKVRPPDGKKVTLSQVLEVVRHLEISLDTVEVHHVYANDGHSCELSTTAKVSAQVVRRVAGLV